MSIIDKLRAAGIANPVREFQILADNFSDESLDQAIALRLTRVPLSHILGRRWFWKHEFFVNSHVLDPRPDSEILIERALEKTQIDSILDLGAGSGALGISLLFERPEADLVLADISSQALETAQIYAQRILPEHKVHYVQSDWLQNIRGQFDIILCNPPYIAKFEMEILEKELTYEPRIALTDEEDGLSAYRQIAKSLKKILKPEGIAYFEHGFSQQNHVMKIFEEEDFHVTGWKDLSQNDRVVQVQLYS